MAQGAKKGLLQQLIAREALSRLIDDVRDTGAVVMPLKGVLLVALGIRKAAERPMIDVDVLVQPSVARAAALAAQDGTRQRFARRLAVRAGAAGAGTNVNCLAATWPLNRLVVVSVSCVGVQVPS